MNTAAEKLPGVRRITILDGGDDAREPNIYRIAEVYFDSFALRFARLDE